MVFKRKVIIFLVKFIPAPAYDGGAVRNKAWIDFLAKKYHVIVLGYWNKKYGTSHLDSLLSPNVEVVGQRFNNGWFHIIITFIHAIITNKSFLLKKYRSKKLEKKLLSAVSGNDISFIMCSELPMMHYVKDENLYSPVYFDAHNVEHRLIERAVAHVGRIMGSVLKREVSRVKKFEIGAVEHADKVFTATEEDRRDLITITGIKSEKIRVVHNSYHDKGGSSNNFLTQHPTIVFIGNLGWLPNKHGLLHFVTTILPDLQKRVPDVLFNIIGSNMSQGFKKLEESFPIHIYGGVSEIKKEEIINESWLGVVPLYFASGSRIKIIELWSHGKAVVSTRIGAEGLPKTTGTQIIRTDDEFIGAIIDLLGDKRRIIDMGKDNYEVFRKDYSFDRVYEDTLYNTITAE